MVMQNADAYGLASPAGYQKSPKPRGIFSSAHSDDTVDADMQTKGARAVFMNRAYVEESNLPDSMGLNPAPSTPTARRRNSNSMPMPMPAFADNCASPSGRRPIDVDSRGSSPNTWATASTGPVSATAAVGTPTRRQADQAGMFSPKNRNSSAATGDEVIEISQRPEDEVRSGQPSPTPFDGMSSLRSTSSAASVTGRGSAKSQQVHVWEAEALAMLENGSREEVTSRTAPSTGLVQCTVKVYKGMFGKTSKICMYLDNSEAFLLAARKRKKSKASNFVISVDEEDLGKDSPHCSAKFRANFVGTEYALCSRSPCSSDHTREETCVFFKQNIFAAVPGPRVMMVAVPLPEANWCPIEKDGSDTLSACLEKARLRELGPVLERKLCFLGNRPPEWDEKTKTHILNFHGRVKLASVKNFQLVAWDHNTDCKGSDLILQFGKVSESATCTTYSLDFSYPFSATKAFAVALASLDSKLAYAI